jgi:hypothetical protein
MNTFTELTLCSLFDIDMAPVPKAPTDSCLYWDDSEAPTPTRADNVVGT